MAGIYEKKVVEEFFRRQGELFPEQVAEDTDGAEEFLEMCDALVCATKKELKDALLEEGLDTAGMSESEIFEEATVLPLGDGRYLVIDV